MSARIAANNVGLKRTCRCGGRHPNPDRQVLAAGVKYALRPLSSFAYSFLFQERVPSELAVDKGHMSMAQVTKGGNCCALHRPFSLTPPHATACSEVCRPPSTSGISNERNQEQTQRT